MVKQSPFSYNDETGWRIDGNNCWLWNFTLKSAIELHTKYKTREIITLDELKQFKETIAKQLIDLVVYNPEHKKVKNLHKLIIKHNQELLTFMEHPEVEPTNNEAERQLRPNVILRKLTFGNRTFTGANNHKILMSIIQTARKNNINPLDILISIVTKPVALISPTKM